MWEFSNHHQWHRDYETREMAETAALDFGLYTHPQIINVEIKEITE